MLTPILFKHYVADKEIYCIAIEKTKKCRCGYFGKVMIWIKASKNDSMNNYATLFLAVSPHII